MTRPGDSDSSLDPRWGRVRRPAGGRLRVAIVAYLLLLLVSHLVRPERGAQLGDHRETTSVPVQTADGRVEGRVEMAWKAWGEETPGALPLVLVHGSPGRHTDFRRLGPALAEERRVLAPDLPGFGASERDVPDYSIRAHARYLLALLDALGHQRFHLLGFSMGGGVALHVYELAPHRVASVTLLSAIGVQELELLGSYRLNHMVHGLQLVLLWFLHEATPHMGLLDGSMLSLPYARNFYDTDQRPLRGILESFRPPMLILHGEDDPLVPAAAAREHARLVPQSELRMLDAQHFFLFTRQPDPVPAIARFLERVEEGRAPARAEAPPERREAARRPFDPSTLPRWSGLTLVVVVLLLAASTAVSEDLTCIGAGLLVAAGRLGFLAATFGCFLGILVTDVVIFGLGRFLGRPALRVPPLRWWIDEETVKDSSAWFRRRGLLVIVLTRFVPGTRVASYFAAGTLHTPFWRFVAYFTLAVALWTPALVGLAMVLGYGALDRVERFEASALLLLVFVVALGATLRWIVLPLFTFRGRRLLVGRWRRLTRWEFWPPWLFYPPVVLWVLALGLRHRCLTLFTAANPGMPAGGFVGESKAWILRRIRDPGETVPRWRLLAGDLPLEEKLAAGEAFLDEHGLDYPVILKPDVGQRGSGVSVVRSPEELEARLRQSQEEILVQEYVAGHELGVFYYRFPDEERGHVLSITDKRFPVLVGDGVSTLEELVLRDERAVCMARVYFRELGPRRTSIPRRGEEVRLVEIGAHARGTLFFDGTDLCTAELEESIDRLSRRIDGFHFGRYDIRTPSIEALRAGGPFKMIEVNGVTSESTNLYDPRNSLRRAYAILFRQWRLAFEMGRRQRQLGHRPTGVLALARLVVAYAARRS